MSSVVPLNLRPSGIALIALGFGLLAIAIWLGYELHSKLQTAIVFALSVAMLSVALILTGFRNFRARPLPIELSHGSIFMPISPLGENGLDIREGNLLSWRIATKLHPLVKVLEVSAKEGICEIPVTCLSRDGLQKVIAHLQSMESNA